MEAPAPAAQVRSAPLSCKACLPRTLTLVERLVTDARSFVKGLRYNLDTGSALASVTLTDCKGSPTALVVAPGGVADNGRCLQMGDPSIPVWFWHPSSEAMPTLPPRLDRRPSVVEAAGEPR
ncbi:MAG: DUF1173 family protein [Thauera sp.]|nr:DUF1173 family protein [Thauera sp.]